MKLEEIHAEWSKDSKINPTDLANESLNTPKLHGKYLQILSGERLKLKKLREEKKSLSLTKTEYFLGRLSKDELNQLGWEPFYFKLLKQDVPTYLEADTEIVKLNLTIGMQEEKVDVLQDIIKTIGNRGFQIKNYIDWKKFENGLG
jgi:hypothetical protein